MPSIDGSDGFYVFGVSFLGSPSSELFLTISGALLLPTKTSINEFYKRRFTKLIPPLIIWSLIGGCIEIVADRFSLNQYVSNALMIPLKPIVGVYWFMYVMIGLYLIAPIISEWLRKASKKELQLVLALWGITLLWPYFNMVLGTSYQEFGSHYETLNYFGGFLGYWILGYYMRRHPISIGWNLETLLPVAAFLVNTAVIFVSKINDTANCADLLSNLQIGSAAMVIIIFTVLQNVKIKSQAIKNTISEIAKYSFGIYLIHIWIVRDLVWPLFENYFRPHVLIQAPLTAIISMIISYLIVKAISKLPYSKYMIGV